MQKGFIELELVAAVGLYIILSSLKVLIALTLSARGADLDV